MKMTELLPGVYKIRKVNYNVPYGAGHGRSSSYHQVHLLRVTGYGEKRRYFIDHDTFGLHPSEIPNDYEVLSKYDGQPQVGNAYITISFADASGESFEFRMKDVWTLRGVFDAMPWLRKPFGYIPRKSRS